MLGANTSVTTYRLQNSGDTSTYSAVATLTNQPAYVESVAAGAEALLGDHPGMARFTVHLDPCDVRVGDRLVDDKTGTEYRVNAVEKYENNEDCDDIYVCQVEAKVKSHSDT